MNYQEMVERGVKFCIEAWRGNQEIDLDSCISDYVAGLNVQRESIRGLVGEISSTFLAEFALRGLAREIPGFKEPTGRTSEEFTLTLTHPVGSRENTERMSPAYRTWFRGLCAKAGIYI